MPDANIPTPTLGVFGEAWAQAIDFASCLLELTRTELGEKFALVGRGIGFLVGATLGLGIAAVFLLIALALFLTASGLRGDLSFALIGFLLALISMGIAFKARRSLSGGVLPTRTISEFRSFVKSTRVANPDGT